MVINMHSLALTMRQVGPVEQTNHKPAQRERRKHSREK